MPHVRDSVVVLFLVGRRGEAGTQAGSQAEAAAVRVRIRGEHPFVVLSLPRPFACAAENVKKARPRSTAVAAGGDRSQPLHGRPQPIPNRVRCHPLNNFFFVRVFFFSLVSRERFNVVPADSGPVRRRIIDEKPLASRFFSSKYYRTCSLSKDKRKQWLYIQNYWRYNKICGVKGLFNIFRVSSIISL